MNFLMGQRIEKCRIEATSCKKIYQQGNQTPLTQQ